MADPRITWHLTATDNVSRTLASIDSRIGKLSGSFRAAFRGIALPTTVVATVGALAAGFARLGASAINMADDMRSASNMLGVSAVVLQRLKIAADQSGSSFDTVQSSLLSLARATTAAANGSEKAITAFGRLGIDARKLAELPLDRQLAVVAEQLKQLPNATQQAAYGGAVLGKGFAELLPTLKNLDTALSETNKVLSDEQVKALADAKEAWQSFGNFAVIQSGRVIAGAMSMWDSLKAGGEIARYDKFKASQQPPAPAEKKKTLSADEAAAIVGLPGPSVLDGIETNIDETMRAVTAAINAFEADRRRVADAARADITQIIENTRTPLEQYRADLARVDELMAYGLSADVAAREVARLGTVLGEQTQAMVDASDAGAAWSRNMRDAADVIESLEQPIDRVADAYLRADRLFSKGLISKEQADAYKALNLETIVGDVDKAATAVESRTTDLLESIRNATDGVARDITAAFFDSTNSIADAFKDMLNRISQSIIEQNIVQPLLDDLMGAVGGLFKRGGGGGVGSIDMSSLPSRRALGGPVTEGRSYLVGETGPELFVPRSSGAVVSNGALAASASGALAITFNVNSLDPRSAATVIAENERVITNVIRRAQVRAGNRPSV